MIYAHRDANKFVYHYCSAHTAQKFILRDWTLQLNTLSATNDPRESKAWEFDLHTAGTTDLGAYDMAKCSAWLSSELKSRTRLVCFVRDQGPLSGDHTEDLLKRGHARSRMWAQYGDRHRGVCLVFDKQRLIEAANALRPREIFTGNVTYFDNYIVRELRRHEFMIDVDLLEQLGPRKYAIAHLKEHHRRLYFEKLTDWRDEFEWRIVVIGNDSGRLKLPLANSVVGIIHGALIDNYVSDDLIAMTERREIEHMGLIWKNSGPWYGIGETRWSRADRATCGWKPREQGIASKARALLRRYVI